MYVYFALGFHPKVSVLKVGVARRPHERMESLQTGCPFPLTMLSCIKCKSEKHARNVERRIHSRFKHLNSQGEWFYYTRELQQWLSGSQSNKDHEICIPDEPRNELDAEFMRITA